MKLVGRTVGKRNLYKVIGAGTHLGTPGYFVELKKGNHPKHEVGTILHVSKKWVLNKLNAGGK